MTSASRGWVIAATFLIALMLTAVPLPIWAAAWRPAWVAMVLVYWCIALPETVGMFSAFAVGLLIDAMLSAPMGQNALALTVVAYIAGVTHQRLRLYPLGQQALIVGLLIMLYLVVIVAVRYALAMQRPDPLRFWFPAVTSAALWPWLSVLLRDLRRRAHLG
jgi:rod shape-determining protein MreD